MSKESTEVAGNLDLAPARWMWLPSARTLPNTFVLFRKRVVFAAPPRRVSGWLLADSRYRLTVDGRRMQWGPAPSDPRWPEADPIELTDALGAGEHVIGLEVLYYGHGDGTWPMGKPGVLLHLEVEDEAGRIDRIVSDATWSCRVDRGHRPGQYKRWYLRSLQEEFDARLHPHGWDTPGCGTADEGWTAAMELEGAASGPPLATDYPDYLYELTPPPEGVSALRRRSVPLLIERRTPPHRLAAAARVEWTRDPADWFDFRMPESMRTVPAAPGDFAAEEPGVWRIPAAHSPREAFALTFEWSEQLVGFPYFTIEAPPGTVVELMTQEAHDPEREHWLDSHKFAWSRFICAGGAHRFECYEYESMRWMQLHIRNHGEPVCLRGVGARRRLHPWPHEAAVVCGEPALQRLMDACVNTMRNNALETLVDGMGRERQQYSGDIGHELHALRYALGDTALSERFLRTYSQGQTSEGYFLDCWPAYDRVVRVPQRELGLTRWGPILDHSVQFVLDNWHHYLETGRREALEETYPRLRRFVDYLALIRGADGLLPVEGLGVPTVWLDQHVYQRQRHKQCAFNLHAIGMLREGMAPLARVMGDEREARRSARLADELLAATVAKYWDAERGLYVCSRPWPDEPMRLCDRSLAAALLYGLCPEEVTAPALQVLAERPPELGRSYPPNAGWRHRALARGGRADVVLREWREEWAQWPSVRLNNTMSEYREARPDSTDQWSHAAVAPLYVLLMDIVGLAPLEPGFRVSRLAPRLSDLARLNATIHTAAGLVRFRSRLVGGCQQVEVEVPAGMRLEVEQDAATTIRIIEE
ncbi:alpha-L-rhamnosidase [Paenibacillus sp. IB182496]|uniref:Alpha-L-rhamnosidase n=1 Tax=Paenibacillus sabuli TaxID=2772509 RepID=A0A927GT51_9BACL|nr:alpha-L-rhamnosidase C-terminal domain-containing protein [Paenibacillus sabuli]MBD2846976.1 alpha-L-rhamnosidase [Paenibacillus sabuli]